MTFNLSPGCNCCGPFWSNPVDCDDVEGCCNSGADNMPDQVTIDFSAGTASDANCSNCDALNAEFTLDIKGGASPYNCFWEYYDTEFCAAPGSCTGADCSAHYELLIEAYIYKPYGEGVCLWVVHLLLKAGPNTWEDFNPAHQDCSSECRGAMIDQNAYWYSDDWYAGSAACDKLFPISCGDGYGGYFAPYGDWPDDGSYGCDGEPPNVCVIEGV